MIRKSSALFSTTLLVLWLAMLPITAQTKTGPVNIDDVLREPVTPDRAKAYYHYALAKLREKESNWEYAEAEVRKALAFDPKSSGLRSEAAEFFLRIRKVTEAIALCKEAIALDRDNADAHLLLGNIYSYVSGQPEFQVSVEEVIREFKEVLRIDPQNSTALYRLGQIYLHNQQPDKAAEVLEQYNKQTGGNEESYYSLALAYDGMNRIDEAIAAVKSAAESQPSPRNLGLLGSLLSKAGRSKDAVETFRKVLGEDANNVEIKKQLAVSLLANNEFDDAITLLEEIVAQDGNDLPSRVQLGKAYFGLRKFDKALEAFEAATKLDPTNLGTRFYIAYTYEEKGETEQALAAFRRLLDDTYKPSGKYSPQEFDDRILFQRHMAFIYKDSGEFEKAIAEFRAILAMQDQPENYRSLVNCLRLAHQNSEALKLNLEARKKYPDDKYLALSHSQLLADGDGFEKGEKLAKELVEQNPTDADYYMSLSQVYLQAKRYDQAEEALKKALQISHGSEMVQFQLGAVYERAKSYEKAEEQFLDIIKKNPRNASALNYLGYMWADRGVRLQEALGHIKRAVELEPNNGGYLDSLGWVYFKLDQLHEAEEYLGAAIRRVKNDPTIHEHLGDLYFKRGQYSKAEGAWQQAILNGTEDEEINKVKEKLDHLKKLQKNMQ